MCNYGHNEADKRKFYYPSPLFLMPRQPPIPPLACRSPCVHSHLTSHLLLTRYHPYKDPKKITRKRENSAPYKGGGDTQRKKLGRSFGEFSFSFLNSYKGGEVSVFIFFGGLWTKGKILYLPSLSRWQHWPCSWTRGTCLFETLIFFLVERKTRPETLSKK